MNIFAFASTRFFQAVLGACLVGLPLTHGAFLAWQEWSYRQSVLAVPAVAPARADTPSVPVAFKPDAIVSVLGLSPQGGLALSTEPLELRASIVSSQGESLALLAGAGEARFYKVGERLPGGSVLRRVEVSQVVLWRNGREERLALEPAGQYLLPAANALAPKAQPTSIYLRPSAGQL